MTRRGEVYWFDFDGSAASRPVVVVSSDRYNASRIATVVVAQITRSPGNRRPGWVPISVGSAAGAIEGSVNVANLATVAKRDLRDFVGRLGDPETVHLDAELDRLLFN